MQRDSRTARGPDPPDRLLTLVNNYGPVRNRALNLVRGRLAELGWVDGRNIIIEPRWAKNQPQRLSALAAEPIALPLDVIVTQTTAATLVAKPATTRIPIVMTGVTQPVNLGIVSSLARPGGNVTAVTDNPGPGFVTKMAQLLMEAAPRVSRLAMLGTEFYMSELEPAGPRLGIEVIRAPASTYHEVPGALAGALRDRADGLFVLPPPSTIPIDRRSSISHWRTTGPRWAATEASPRQAGSCPTGPIGTKSGARRQITSTRS